MSLSAIDLAAELIRFDTINPPGQEAACTDHLARLLTEAGFQCETVPLDKGRPNLVARIGGTEDKPPLAFTGHTDTVPLGAQAWTVAPHGGMVKDGRVWGRGASDMKSGVAAFVVAALEQAARLEGTPGVVLYITAGEETGSEGAFALARRGMRGHAGALVVAEPTTNRPLCGHKGALWLKAITRGVTAHGSMLSIGAQILTPDWSAPHRWTGEVTRIRLFRPGFQGESPWPSTAAIRSSSSGKCRPRGLSVTEGCRLMGLARSTYYDENKGQPIEEVRLITRITEICAEFPRYGYRRVTAQLREDGIIVNHKKFMRLMKEHGLTVQPQRRYVVTTDGDHDGPIFPNLAKNVTPTGPNQLWVADITYIATSFVYLAAILDAWSRRVVGYAIGRRIDARLTLA